MLVGIRVDASLKMGTGHVFRTLTLAEKLKVNGHKVIFLSRCLQGHLIDLIQASFPVLELPIPEGAVSTQMHCHHAHWLEVGYDLEIEQSQQVIKKYLSGIGKVKLDWLIVDHYAIEKKWQLSMKAFYHRCMQIDDLADRVHEVDVLLDQNYYKNATRRYNNLISSKAKNLLGPSYALLRDEFSAARERLKSYNARIEQRQVVLFFGGIDSSNETLKALKGMLSVETQDYFNVIIGANNPNRKVIEHFCAQHPEKVSLHIQVKNMMDFFSKAYLYVGAVGATTWERCVLGLPGIVCAVADNQRQLAEDLAQINGHYYLGESKDLSESDYSNKYQELIFNTSSLKVQSAVVESLIDGNGCQRVITKLEEISNHDKL